LVEAGENGLNIVFCARVPVWPPSVERGSGRVPLSVRDPHDRLPKTTSGPLHPVYKAAHCRRIRTASTWRISV